jgi:hypothetical protein
MSEEEPTTPDLVELARQSADAMGRGDLEVMLSFYAPDAAFDLLGAGGGVEARGRDQSATATVTRVSARALEVAGADPVGCTRPDDAILTW